MASVQDVVNRLLLPRVLLVFGYSFRPAAADTTRAACRRSLGHGTRQECHTLATHLGSADGIAVSVAPHFATSWTTPYPDFPGFPGPMGVDPAVRAGRLEKPQTALVPSSLPQVSAHMPAREATKDQDGQRLVAHALGQSRSRPRDCFPPSRIKWPDGYSQPAWLSCLMIY